MNTGALDDALNEADRLDSNFNALAQSNRQLQVSVHDTQRK